MYALLHSRDVHGREFAQKSEALRLENMIPCQNLSETAESRVEDWRGVSKVKPICYRLFRLTVPH